MALTWWQKRQYRDSLDVWRPTTGSDSQGVAQAPTWQRVLSSVPCYCQFTDNLNDPAEGAGRNKRMTVFTLDAIHMELGVGRQIRADDRLYITAQTADGPVRFWERVEGSPEMTRGPGNFANKAKLLQMEEEKPDATLRAAAGV